MKSKTRMAMSLIIGLSAISSAAFADEVTGEVKMYLMNPEGKVDGLLLVDGTQVHFPPHLSTQLVSAVKKSDSVKIEGTKEATKVVRADTITNTKSGTTLTDTPPTAGEEPPPPPPRPPGPMGARRGLKEMTVSGVVTEELYGRRGEVNGVVLGDQTIVHFGPRLLDKSNPKLAKGSSVKITGFGVKNEYGESIEATEVTQK